METKLIIDTLNFERILLPKLESLILNFDFKIKTTRYFDDNKNFVIELELISEVQEKSFSIQYSMGINVDSEWFEGLNFMIRKNPLNSEQEYIFLHDLCKFLNIEYNNTGFIIGKVDSENFLNYELKILDNIELQNKIRQLVFSNFWINIKPDYSPYK